MTSQEIDLKIVNCLFCQKKYYSKELCPPCWKRDTHHGKKAPVGKCQQCLIKTDDLVKEWNDRYYCRGCKEWNDEACESGVATCARYIKNKEINCYNSLERKCCGNCSLCLERKKLSGVSTLALMTELYWGRENFDALISWEDDGFITRFQELMWELNEVKEKRPKEIEKLVNQDVFEKKPSQRKFSRGT